MIINYDVTVADLHNNDNKMQIISLWRQVFGDEVEYIVNFISNCRGKKCLVIRNGDGVIVSMLFLIDCTLGDMNGAYVYAVATAAEYRKRGYMSAMLDKSKKMPYDFLCLVPAHEYLFNVYKKHGFCYNIYKQCSLRKSDIINNRFCSMQYGDSVKTLLEHDSGSEIILCDTKYIYDENIFTGGLFLTDGKNNAAVRYDNVIKYCPDIIPSDEIAGLIWFYDSNTSYKQKKVIISFILD